MRVVLSGAERGASRRLLLANKVERVGVNLSQLSVPKIKPFSVPETFAGTEVWLYTSEDDEDDDRYDQFLRDHHDDLYAVIGRNGYDGKWLGSKYIPLWNDGADVERLAFLCEKNQRVAVSDKALNKDTLNRIRQLADRWGTKMVVITSKVDFLTAYEWDAILVAHWTSVMKYGETQVWDGHGLRRYSAKQKSSARRKHRADIQRLDVDPDEVMDDNADAVATLAIRSWLELEMAEFGAYHLDQGDHDHHPSTPPEGGVATTPPPTGEGANSGNSPAVLTNTPPEKRHESDRRLLPLMALQAVNPRGAESDESGDSKGFDGNQVSVSVARSGQNLRQCDSCYLSSRCPGFKGGAECVYEFPVRLESMNQLKAMCNMLLELQLERVMFGAFAEQLEGQGADPTVSKEFDRVFSMVEAIRNLNDDRDVFSLKVEARSGAGVIDRIFGSKVTDQLGALPTPVDTNDVVTQLGIVDAEVVEDNGHSS